MKRRTLRLVSFIFMSLVMFVTPLGVSFIPAVNKKTQESQTVSTRTIETREQEVDYQSILNSYEDAILSTEGLVTYFEGTKKLDASIFSEIDNLSESDVGELNAISVRYYYSFDAETSIVTLSAETKNEQGAIIEIEEIYGAAFINEDGNIDALLDVDGDYILLSELQEAGMIANCGWFKKLFKKVVKAAVNAVVVAVVATTIVATCGAGLGAVIAVGAAAGAIAGGATGAVSSYKETGKVQAEDVLLGVGVGAAVGALTGLVVGKVSGAGKVADKADDVAKVADKADDVAKVADKADDAIKIANRGSTGRTTPNDLNEKLFMEEVKSNPLENAKELKDVVLKDSRWPSSEGWVKMQRTYKSSDGSTKTIHYVYNKLSNLFDDFKFI